MFEFIKRSVLQLFSLTGRNSAERPIEVINVNLIMCELTSSFSISIMNNSTTGGPASLVAYKIKRVNAKVELNWNFITSEQ